MDTQFLIYDDINLLGENINTTNESTQTLLDDSGEVGLEVTAEKSKYIFMSRHQNAGKYHNQW
jgi:hypothetical protein